MILIGLGANLPSAHGTPRETLRAALALMPAYGISPMRVSSFYSTPALANDVQPPYVNAVAVIETVVSSSELLAKLHRIEALFGRVRETRWAPRTLDLDLLDYQGQIVTADGPRGADAGTGPLPLVLPHPGIEARGFVLVPLAEVAPKWVHPRIGVSAEVLIERLKGADGVAALAGIHRI